MSQWWSAEWFDETRPLWASVPLRPAVSARIQCDVTGGPERSLPSHWVLEDGRLTASGPGPVEDPDVTLTIAWDDALALHRGDLDPTVAFMRGRLKVAGSMGVVLDLLPATRSDAYREALARVAAVTDL